MLGSLILYLKAIRIVMFQLSGFYYKPRPGFGGLGFRVWVQGLGFRVQGLGFRGLPGPQLTYLFRAP